MKGIAITDQINEEDYLTFSRIEEAPDGKRYAHFDVTPDLQAVFSMEVVVPVEGLQDRLETLEINHCTDQETRKALLRAAKAYHPD